jgi:predicted adenine nucleotide alpha hydrolase (AANH) superfamily ATPase
MNQKLVSSNQALWSLRESENAGVQVLALNLQKMKHLSVAKDMRVAKISLGDRCSICFVLSMETKWQQRSDT